MKSLDRRSFFVQSLTQTLGAAALLATTKVAHGAICTVSARQTSGPFIPNDFPFRDPDEGAPYIPNQDMDADLTVVSGNQGSDGKPAIAGGQIIYVRGQVVDQSCNPVPSANVYIWQADQHGHYNHSEDTNVHSINDLDANFQYRAHVMTDANGRFQIKTIKPKYYPLNETGSLLRTAHLHIAITHAKCAQLTTQTYFEGDVLEDIETIRSLNAKDIILAPRGQILPELKPLIINFAQRSGFEDGPVGDVVLTVRRTAQ